MIRQILVVCIGNICRSPMAEGLLKQALPDVSVSSAGLDALVGHGADPIAIGLMNEAGINISTHRARMLNDSLTREADLILVMDERQKQQIAGQYPYARGKIFRLGEAGKQDIQDPYRQGPDVFQTVFSLIENGVNEWTRRINSLG